MHFYYHLRTRRRRRVGSSFIFLVAWLFIPSSSSSFVLPFFPSVSAAAFFLTTKQQRQRRYTNARCTRSTNSRVIISFSSSSLSSSSSSDGGSSDESRSHSSSSSSSKRKRKRKKKPTSTAAAVRTYSARFIQDNGLTIATDEDGRVTARPSSSSVTTTATAATTTPARQREDEEDNNDQVEANSSKKARNDNNLNKISSNSTHNSSKKKEPIKMKRSLSSSSDATQQQQQQRNSKRKKSKITSQRKQHKPPVLNMENPLRSVPMTGFNVVLTHATADFDSLASAVGLAKLWSNNNDDNKNEKTKSFDSASHVPTFVVLPRGAHPGVARFLALHKHLFPIRSLKSLPSDLSNLNRLALVDAQRRDRLGPAESLLQHANRVTVVDHHIDQDSDINATDYVVDKVGSVTTLITEYLQDAINSNMEEGDTDTDTGDNNSNLKLTEAEATLLALGIHADTGSLCFDSTTARDAKALAWCMEQGASQAAIAEHAQSSLSQEQQGVLTQALLNANVTVVHGVTVSTVLLTADGFINGLAAVTQDALELCSSDIFLLGVVYEAQSGGRRRRKNNRLRRKDDVNSGGGGGGNMNNNGHLLTSRLLAEEEMRKESTAATTSAEEFASAWQGGKDVLRRKRLRAAFDRKDTDGSDYLSSKELASALAASGVIASQETVQEIMEAMDTDGNGKIDFEEFVALCDLAEEHHQQQRKSNGGKSSTLIIIGRVRAGVHNNGVKLHKLLERLGGGGHSKAASATLRLNNNAEASQIMQGLVDELVETSLQKQSTVGDFMTAPVLSVQPHMTEKQVEDLFLRYDVRALPVVDEDNDVIGLVTYKEVAAAKQRLWNKEQKRLRQAREAAEKGRELPPVDPKILQERKHGTTVKGWMLQHVRVVEASKTMAEVESILLEADVGCIPVVADGTKQLVGMVTRTDLLRQHRYYPSLHYHNKGFADSIAARKPMIELRKKLKRFDVE